MPDWAKRKKVPTGPDALAPEPSVSAPRPKEAAAPATGDAKGGKKATGAPRRGGKAQAEQALRELADQQPLPLNEYVSETDEVEDAAPASVADAEAELLADAPAKTPRGARAKQPAPEPEIVADEYEEDDEAFEDDLDDVPEDTPVATVDEETDDEETDDEDLLEVEAETAVVDEDEEDAADFEADDEDDEDFEDDEDLTDEDEEIEIAVDAAPVTVAPVKVEPEQVEEDQAEEEAEDDESDGQVSEGGAATEQGVKADIEADEQLLADETDTDADEETAEADDDIDEDVEARADREQDEESEPAEDPGVTLPLAAAAVAEEPAPAVAAPKTEPEPAPAEAESHTVEAAQAEASAPHRAVMVKGSEIEFSLSFVHALIAAGVVVAVMVLAFVLGYWRAPSAPDAPGDTGQPASTGGQEAAPNSAAGGNDAGPSGIQRERLSDEVVLATTGHREAGRYYLVIAQLPGLDEAEARRIQTYCMRSNVPADVVVVEQPDGRRVNAVWGLVGFKFSDSPNATEYKTDIEKVGQEYYRLQNKTGQFTPYYVKGGLEE